jgi:glycosyltransferase involved in cell wall biosynthesis
VQQGSLQWLGFRKDVLELYALSDVAVLPSYYKEGGYPRALLEPMALAKPVIAADTDDCKGPVRHGENGFLVPPGDGKALAERIEELFKDPALRARFGSRSLEIMREEFDDRIVGMQVLAEMGLQT